MRYQEENLNQQANYASMRPGQEAPDERETHQELAETERAASMRPGQEAPDELMMLFSTLLAILLLQ